jgi:bifunctional non-homologous end joining protein LigD
MSLRNYRAKRRADKSPEPGIRAGRKTQRRRSGGDIFVVQKHDASHLHYDFRLQIGATLKSWAVPKGPSINPADRTLAVEVEDHPLDYASFEGTIPQGQYGGGTVMIWDTGRWKMIDAVSPSAGWHAGKLKFELLGTRLKGAWTLVRMRTRGDGAKRNWLLIKDRDRHASSAADADPRNSEATSVISGRTMDEIASSGQTASRSNRTSRSASAKRNPAGRTTRTGPRTKAQAPIQGAVEAPQPSFLSPPLATLVDAPPVGDQWRYEMKFDGYRILAFIHDGQVRLHTRNGKDWTAKFPVIAAEVAGLGTQGILDGEVVALDRRGVSQFQALQTAISDRDDRSLVYYVFDVPYWEGRDLTACALRDRAAHLARILPGRDQGTVRLSRQIESDAKSVLSTACRLGLEGLIAKDNSSLYSAGVRTRDWLKLKCGSRQEFVIGGFTTPRNSRIGFGSLLLGYHQDGGLRYAGNVGSGFDSDLLSQLSGKLARLRRATSPFADPAEGPHVRNPHWVRPALVCEVSFSQWTRDGRLRHPVFQGLRADKPPTAVTREKVVNTFPSNKSHPMPDHTVKAGVSTRRNPARDDQDLVMGVRITHPDREVYKGTGITKRDLAAYYASIASLMLPYLKDRPISVLRCPSGAPKASTTGGCFFHKHLDLRAPGLRSTPITESKGTYGYLIVESAEGLVALAQMNVLEIHTWGARDDQIEKPDQIVFDLDPGEGIEWADIVHAATIVRKALRERGLAAFAKTSGGRGLHIVAPIHRTATWSDLKAASRTLAEDLAGLHPDLFVAKTGASNRKGRVFIDYLRNSRGATTVAPYSTRARRETVSMPLAWSDLPRTPPERFTIGRLLEKPRASRADPWRAYPLTRQRLRTTAASRRAR